MSSLKITVNIADREYRLNIPREKEEVIRRVAQSVNESIKKYAENFEFKDKQDLLAMVVLQNAIRNKELEQEVEFQQSQLSGKLEEIDRVISQELSTQVWTFVLWKKIQKVSRIVRDNLAKILARIESFHVCKLNTLHFRESLGGTKTGLIPLRWDSVFAEQWTFDSHQPP